MALIPENVRVIEIDAEAIETIEDVRTDAADFFIDFETGRITSQRITGTDKAIQWLGIGCKTERDRFPIFGDFGTPFEQMISDDLPRAVAEGELVRNIEELAAEHELIQNLEVEVDFQGNRAKVNVLVNGQKGSVVIE
ncbi:DUF2634 domain-containing protein [Sporosarcina sp. A2]|uniref:DUF2634 domain-containing protein n=1 Tax=Sporosarcina sp. A2 TaxID=3393449 RepID=UPI003D79D74A